SRRRDLRWCEGPRDDVPGDVDGSAGQLSEMLEVGRRGEQVERALVRGMMLAKVVEDVNEGLADGARGRERAPVPAIRPEGTAPKDQAVHAARDANREAAHSGAESALVERLDQQVHVIGLHREVDDAKRVRGSRIRLRNSEAHRRKKRTGSEATGVPSAASRERDAPWNARHAA